MNICVYKFSDLYVMKTKSTAKFLNAIYRYLRVLLLNEKNDQSDRHHVENEKIFLVLWSELRTEWLEKEEKSSSQVMRMLRWRIFYVLLSF